MTYTVLVGTLNTAQSNPIIAMNTFTKIWIKESLRVLVA